jgi:hypothetical protein
MTNRALRLSPLPRRSAPSRRRHLRLVAPPRPRPPRRARAVAAYASGLTIGFALVAATSVPSGPRIALTHLALAGLAAVVASAALVVTRAHARALAARR